MKNVLLQLSKLPEAEEKYHVNGEMTLGENIGHLKNYQLLKFMFKFRKKILNLMKIL